MVVLIWDGLAVGTFDAADTGVPKKLVEWWLDATRRFTRPRVVGDARVDVGDACAHVLLVAVAEQTDLDDIFDQCLHLD